jgi:hypothetical protein
MNITEAGANNDQQSWRCNNQPIKIISPNIRQLTKLRSMATHDATYAPVLEPSSPDIVVSNQPRCCVYPHWFLLKWQHLVPVALKTRYVGFAAFGNMRSARRLMIVPPWVEKVIESIDSLIWLDNSGAQTLVTIVRDIHDWEEQKVLLGPLSQNAFIPFC